MPWLAAKASRSWLIPEDLGLHAERLPAVGIGAALQVTGVHRAPAAPRPARRSRDRSARRSRRVPSCALVLVVVLQKRIRRARHAGDVARVDEALGTQRLGVAHQQLHGLLRGLALAAVEHLLFVVGEIHHQAAGPKDRP